MIAACVSDSACTVNVALSAIGASPSAVRTSPTTSISATLPMKRYVGTANALLASRTPRRLTAARITMNPTAITTRYGARNGSAEMMLSTPAATETATVMM